MKKKFLVGNQKKFRFPIYVVLIFMLASCVPDSNDLGINIFPPDDSIFVYTDTLYNLETNLVSSKVVFSSVYTTQPSSDKLFLLGALNDTITGLSSADVVTQVALSSLGNFGTDPLLDSLRFWLYCSDVEGDTTSEMHIKIHEFTGELLYENAYFSDYDIEGQYVSVPLVEKTITPKPDTYYEFYVTDQVFLNRISQAIKDSAFASVDSIQSVFKGFYITTEVDGTSNSMAKIGLANPISRLGFQYVHDSIDVDSVTEDSWDWYYMNFSELYTQKVNMFHHDFTGTALNELIDNPDAQTPILYVQGMAGVNVEIGIPEFDNYMGGEAISINSAKLVFDVVPDDISGIEVDDYPPNLMMAYETSDSSRQVVYDFLANTSTYNFGKLTRSNSVSAFLPPLYQYKFNVGLHLQSVLSGDLENVNLILYVNDPATTAKIIKLWSNESEQEGSLRLELVYTKF